MYIQSEYEDDGEGCSWRRLQLAKTTVGEDLNDATSSSPSLGSSIFFWLTSEVCIFINNISPSSTDNLTPVSSFYNSRLNAYLLTFPFQFCTLFNSILIAEIVFSNKMLHT